MEKALHGKNGWIKIIIYMNSKKLKETVLHICIRYMDEPPERWSTFNDMLHSRILDDDYKVFIPDVVLSSDEIPIFESFLPNSYLLITTSKVISKIENEYDEVLIKEIKKITPNYNENNLYPKIHKIEIEKMDGNKLVYFIESHHPSFFSIILIKNLVSYVQTNNWYINPTKYY